MLKLLSTSENVAFYSYGSKIYKILLQAIYSFTVVVLPRIAYLYKMNDRDGFNRLISKTLNIIYIIAIPIIIGTMFVGDYIITALFGAEYISSSAILKILSIILLIAPTGYLLGSRILLVTGNEKKMIFPVLAGVVVNVILNYFLIKQFDHYGAALATVAGELAVMVMYIILAKKYFKFVSFMSSLIKTIISAGVMTLVLFLLCKGDFVGNLTLTIKEIFVGASIYFLALAILQEKNTKIIIQKIQHLLFG